MIKEESTWELKTLKSLLSSSKRISLKEALKQMLQWWQLTPPRPHSNKTTKVLKLRNLAQGRKTKVYWWHRVVIGTLLRTTDFIKPLRSPKRLRTTQFYSLVGEITGEIWLGQNSWEVPTIVTFINNLKMLDQSEQDLPRRPLLRFKSHQPLLRMVIGFMHLM